MNPFSSTLTQGEQVLVSLEPQRGAAFHAPPFERFATRQRFRGLIGHHRGVEGQGYVECLLLLGRYPVNINGAFFSNEGGKGRKGVCNNQMTVVAAVGAP